MYSLFINVLPIFKFIKFLQFSNKNRLTSSLNFKNKHFLNSKYSKFIPILFNTLYKFKSFILIPCKFKYFIFCLPVPLIFIVSIFEQFLKFINSNLFEEV